jgi:ribosome modulation factor
MNSFERDLYDRGKQSGTKGKESCPYGVTSMRHRGLWLAGWHDYQIENGTGLR